MKRQAIAHLFIAFILALSWPAAAFRSVLAEADSNSESAASVFITELQTHGSLLDEDGELSTDGTMEFVELYNPHDEYVSIDGWRLEFINQAGTTTRVVAAFHDTESTAIKIPPKEFFVISYEDYLPEADYYIEGRFASGYLNYHDGSVLLLDDSEEVADLVGYGSATYYQEEPALSLEDPDTSLFRCFSDEGLVNSENNAEDFFISSQPSPWQAAACDEPDAPGEDDTDNGSHDDEGDSNEQDNPEDEKTDPDENTPTDTDYCDGIVFSELLPNPQGPRSEFPRAEHAFIELHNTTNDTVSLYGCGLQSSANTTIYWFTEDDKLDGHEYRAFYEGETDVQLPVAPSGTVYLLTTDQKEADTQTYPAGMPEAASWSWFGNDTWEITYSTTPHQENEEMPLRPCPEGQERNPDTNRCRNIESSTETLSPCPEGQERNPETNRCRNVAAAASQFVPCGPGQERNPETNRCRNINQASQLVPCGEGQERNPETNRCRSISSASTDLVPCGPGQERNPETNRCRNVVEPNSETMGVQDVHVAASSDNANWLLSGFVLGSVLLYGGWEWRLDAKRILLNVKRRLSTRI